jgi:hypothetical protein
LLEMKLTLTGLMFAGCWSHSSFIVNVITTSLVVFVRWPL